MSVLLPVYNAGPHLAKAVGSILDQTHGDLELIAVDDGATDGSGEFLDTLTDPRVRVIHQRNQGLVCTLNIALAAASHELVARMDHDDIAAPDRLRLQAAALEARPELVAVGSCYEVIDESGQPVREVHVPSNSEYLTRQLYFRNVLPHGGMMFRRSAVASAGGYRAVGPAEDYDLWVRLAHLGKVSSLPIPLIKHRITTSGMSQTMAADQRAARRRIRAQLHAQHPLRVPSPRQLAGDALRLPRTQAQCPGLLASWVFDHAGLAVQMVRARRKLDVMRLTGAITLVALRRPSSLAGLGLFRNDGEPRG